MKGRETGGGRKEAGGPRPVRTDQGCPRPGISRPNFRASLIPLYIIMAHLSRDEWTFLPIFYPLG